LSGRRPLATVSEESTVSETSDLLTGLGRQLG
jgi:hypothetical protein